MTSRHNYDNHDPEISLEELMRELEEEKLERAREAEGRQRKRETERRRREAKKQQRRNRNDQGGGITPMQDSSLLQGVCETYDLEALLSHDDSSVSLLDMVALSLKDCSLEDANESFRKHFNSSSGSFGERLQLFLQLVHEEPNDKEEEDEDFNEDLEHWELQDSLVYTQNRLQTSSKSQFPAVV